MTNLGKALARLREERREAQHQVQNLGKPSQYLRSSPRFGSNNPGRLTATREARALSRRTPENFSRSESALGKAQAVEESCLKVDWDSLANLPSRD